MRSFFGLTPDYMEAVYEQFFFLKYSGGWSFSEAYNLPIGLRVWFVERLIKQLKMEKEAMESAQAQPLLLLAPFLLVYGFLLQY